MAIEPDLQTISEAALVNPPLTKTVAPSDEVSFIPMADVSDSAQWIGGQTRQERQVSVGYTPFEERDVLFAKITPCMENGKGCHAIGLVNGVGYGSTEFHVLRARPGTNDRFLYHWSVTDAVRKKAEAFMIGSAGQQRVQASFFSHFRIPRLGEDEQRLAAQILDAADEAIAKTEALIAKLRAIKRGLLHDLLTRGLDDNGELRPPSKGLPKGWERNALSDYVPIAEYGISSALSDRDDVPVLRMHNISEGHVELSDLKYASCGAVAGRLLSEGDVLFNRTNSMEHVGRTGIWRGELSKASFASYLVRLLPDRAKLLPDYLNLWLNWPETQRRIRRHATTGVQQVNINPSNLRTEAIELPIDVLEQQRIVAICASHETRIRSEETYLSKLKAIKKGLMQDLLTGRVSVPAGKVPESATG